MLERRRSRRLPVDLYFNRYVDGHPYLCRAVNVSAGGALAHTYVEPDNQPGSFAVELELPGTTEPVWAWVHGKRRECGRLAMRFLGVSADDRQRLAEFVAGA